jgi:hypothetical protein
VHTAYYFTPTNRTTESVEEFLATCKAMPDIAGHHLASGWFEAWLRDQGREDLAQLAAEVRAQPDGLERFLKNGTRQSRTRRAPKAVEPGQASTRRRTKKAA